MRTLFLCASKLMNAMNGFLNEPLQPGDLRDCPSSRALFALEFVSKCDDKEQGVLSTFACKKCGQQFEFAEHHPPDAV